MDELAGLNGPQREAVCHIDGPLLMLAGPGSGKTRVVTHRIAHLLQHGVHPKQILALTFTNKAADEMRNRLARQAPRQPVWMGTFHRFCAQILRVHAPLVGLSENFSICDMDDSGRLLRHVLDEAAIDQTHMTTESIIAAISWAKSNLITAGDYTPKADNLLGTTVAKIYPMYQERLLAANAVDFDDLLLHVATMLRENPELRHNLDERYRYILVDEYQDTNLAQYAIVRALSIDYPNLAVTGDPDQSIYGWRGANLNNILDFERDYPGVKVVRLEENYRSTKRILHVAQTLIGHNVKRKDKTLFTSNGEGNKVRLANYQTARDEADDIAEQIAHSLQENGRRPRDFAILYRTNALSRLFEHSLRRRGIPYQIIHGLEFYQRKEIKDAIAYLQVLNNPKNDVALERIINTPPRQIGKATIATLSEHARQQRIPLLDAARNASRISGLNSRASGAVTRFTKIIDELSHHIDDPLPELIQLVLDQTGYRTQLASSELAEDAERLANLEELITAAREFDDATEGPNRLERFLEQSALVADTDDWESESDVVTLMTLHAAKGLEFSSVFIVCVEQGILPHERNINDLNKLEEERRLLFVGITRAAEELQLSYAESRMRGGRDWLTIASPFLMEIPREDMLLTEPPSRRRSGRGSDDFQADPVYEDEWFDDGPSYEFEDEHSPAKKNPVNRKKGASSATEPSWNDEPDLPSKRASDVTLDVEYDDGETVDTSDAVHLTDEIDGPASGVPPEAFRFGMMVRHPELGPGRIIKLHGLGKKRMAVVKFASEQRSFCVYFSPLVPMNGRK